jgi:hypothetical protein
VKRAVAKACDTPIEVWFSADPVATLGSTEVENRYA